MALEARMRMGHSEHPDTLIPMSNLAMTYVDEGRAQKAVDIQRTLVEVGKRTLGDEHADTRL